MMAQSAELSRSPTIIGFRSSLPLVMSTIPSSYRTEPWTGLGMFKGPQWMDLYELMEEMDWQCQAGGRSSCVYCIRLELLHKPKWNGFSWSQAKIVSFLQCVLRIICPDSRSTHRCKVKMTSIGTRLFIPSARGLWKFLDLILSSASKWALRMNQRTSVLSFIRLSRASFSGCVAWAKDQVIPVAAVASRDDEMSRLLLILLLHTQA